VRRLLAVVGVLVVAAAVAGCGGDDGGGATSSPSGTACRAADQGRVTIVAKDLAWDTDCLQGTLGGELTIELDNRDDGVNHDLHIKGAPGDPHTPLAAGPVTQHLQVALPAGTYEYVCDIHPAMVGKLHVG
jgi:plastocyanin